MARRAEARAPVVAGADLRLAEAAIRCRPRRADIARNDLSKSLYSDPRRAEEAADGAPAYSAADAPSQGRHHEERTGTDRRYRVSIREAAGRGRGSAPCQVTGKEIFSPGRTTSYIATLVERHTRFAMLLKVPSRDTATVVAALAKHVRKLPQRAAPLLDLGSRQGDGRPQESSPSLTNVQVYFCDPPALGSAAATRTPTACCDSISRAEPISRRFSQALPEQDRAAAQSTPTQDLWASKPLPIDYERCCSDRLNPPPKADIGQRKGTR